MNNPRPNGSRRKAARVFFWCAVAAVLLAAGFLVFALNHPECGTPFGLPLRLTWIGYGLYLAVTALLFGLSAWLGHASKKSQ